MAVEPGGTTAQVALVTCRVRPHKPRDIDSASEANECTQTNETLVQYTDLVRSLLMRFYGYECKEPDQGNFTLCFCRLEDALAYCVTLQVRVFSSCHYEERRGSILVQSDAFPSTRSSTIPNEERAAICTRALPRE